MATLEYDSPPPLAKLIRAGGLWFLHHAGFKLVLIYPDRSTPVKWGDQPYEKPWTKAEFATQIVDRVYNSNEAFSGIATALGRTHLTDNQSGRPLYLNALDVDSLSVYQTLESVIERCKELTYITRSRRSFGHHLYWMSTRPLPHISKMDMVDQHHLGSFELKTDKSLGLMTLPPSHHREHASFQYYAVGQNFKIMTDDSFYKKLLISLQEFIQPEFLYRPDVLELVGGRENIKVEEPKPKPKVVSNKRLFRKGELHGLTDDEINFYVASLKPYYHEPNRQTIVFYLSGFLHRRFVTIESAQRIIEALARYDNDRELSSRLKTLQATYSKPRDKVTGSLGQFTKLLESITGGVIVAQ